jgi:WhiB family redox-sensing transcriptional regulator
MTTVKYWQEDAACRGADPDELFAESTRQKRAKAVCEGCPVRIDCLVEALDNRIEWGVWGGMTERERRSLLRRRPGVASWRHVLDSARAEQQQPQPS